MAKIDRESYFDLPVSDQADVLQSLAPVMGRRAEILEKDIWLCQVLDILFQLPCRKPMAFKGGTSLSKVYKAIDRFSEDIDVTVDYRSLVADAPELESITRQCWRRRCSTATPCHSIPSWSAYDGLKTKSTQRGDEHGKYNARLFSTARLKRY